jgi:hypothetical protein
MYAGRGNFWSLQCKGKERVSETGRHANREIGAPRIERLRGLLGLGFAGGEFPADFGFGAEGQEGGEGAGFAFF